jgi:ABC-type Na+ efflux pump permease subunit
MKEITLQSQFRKLQQRRELLVILLFLLVIVFFWITLSLFSSQFDSGITPEQQKLAVPLSPNLDLAVIEKLEQKHFFDSSELTTFPVYTVQPVIAANVSTSTSGESTEQAVTLPQDLENTLQLIEENF